eukprot:GHVT01001465.1.p1 GENE.GHVT01001465.1~~GHVT01001465.1.p1  ORF type:complete len:1042 (+),score=214.09 GHVT01001465.1:902-4027(+)
MTTILKMNMEGRRLGATGGYPSPTALRLGGQAMWRLACVAEACAQMPLMCRSSAGQSAQAATAESSAEAHTPSPARAAPRNWLEVERFAKAVTDALAELENSRIDPTPKVDSLLEDGEANAVAPHHDKLKKTAETNSALLDSYRQPATAAGGGHHFAAIDASFAAMLRSAVPQSPADMPGLLFELLVMSFEAVDEWRWKSTCVAALTRFLAANPVYVRSLKVRNIFQACLDALPLLHQPATAVGRMPTVTTPSAGTAECIRDDTLSAGTAEVGDEQPLPTPKGLEVDNDDDDARKETVAAALSALNFLLSTFEAEALKGAIRLAPTAVAVTPDADHDQTDLPVTTNAEAPTTQLDICGKDALSVTATDALQPLAFHLPKVLTIMWHCAATAPRITDGGPCNPSAHVGVTSASPRVSAHLAPPSLLPSSKSVESADSAWSSPLWSLSAMCLHVVSRFHQQGLINPSSVVAQTSSLFFSSCGALRRAAARLLLDAVAAASPDVWLSRISHSLQDSFAFVVRCTYFESVCLFRRLPSESVAPFVDFYQTKCRPRRAARERVIRVVVLQLARCTDGNFVANLQAGFGEDSNAVKRLLAALHANANVQRSGQPQACAEAAQKDLVTCKQQTADLQTSDVHKTSHGHLTETEAESCTSADKCESIEESETDVQNTMGESEAPTDVEASPAKPIGESMDCVPVMPPVTPGYVRMFVPSAVGGVAAAAGRDGEKAAAVGDLASSHASNLDSYVDIPESSLWAVLYAQFVSNILLQLPFLYESEMLFAVHHLENVVTRKLASVLVGCCDEQLIAKLKSAGHSAVEDAGAKESSQELTASSSYCPADQKDQNPPTENHLTLAAFRMAAGTAIATAILVKQTIKTFYKLDEEACQAYDPAAPLAKERPRLDVLGFGADRGGGDAYGSGNGRLSTLFDLGEFRRVVGLVARTCGDPVAFRDMLFGLLQAAADDSKAKLECKKARDSDDSISDNDAKSPVTSGVRTPASATSRHAARKGTRGSRSLNVNKAQVENLEPTKNQLNARQKKTRKLM